MAITISICSEHKIKHKIRGLLETNASKFNAMFLCKDFPTLKKLEKSRNFKDQWKPSIRTVKKEQQKIVVMKS